VCWRKKRKEEEESCSEDKEAICQIEYWPIDNAFESKMNPVANGVDGFALSPQWCVPVKCRDAETIVEVSQNTSGDTG